MRIALSIVRIVWTDPTSKASTSPNYPWNHLNHGSQPGRPPWGKEVWKNCDSKWSHRRDPRTSRWRTHLAIVVTVGRISNIFPHQDNHELCFNCDVHVHHVHIFTMVLMNYVVIVMESYHVFINHVHFLTRVLVSYVVIIMEVISSLEWGFVIWGWPRSREGKSKWYLTLSPFYKHKKTSKEWVNHLVPCHPHLSPGPFWNIQIKKF